MRGYALAAAGLLLLASLAAAFDRYDDIAAQALARAIHQRILPVSEFIPAPEQKPAPKAKPRRPTVTDSYDRFEQPVQDPFAKQNKSAKKKAAPKKTTVRRVVIPEPVYYQPAPSYGFGGGFGGGFSGGGSCGPGG